MECISGNKAYVLSTPTFDIDIKGIFVLPKNKFYVSDYIPQVSDKSNDVVYYELRRYLELVAVNNPNVYSDLLKMADDLNAEMQQAIEQSSLPNSPDIKVINNLRYSLKGRFYTLT